MDEAEECIALGCREPVRGEDLLLCPTHAVEWREDTRSPPDYGAAAQGWEQQITAQRAAEGQAEIVSNGIFSLGDASPEAIRAVDWAICIAFPHSVPYADRNTVPGESPPPCRRCGQPATGACRQHPDLLAILGVR